MMLKKSLPISACLVWGPGAMVCFGETLLLGQPTISEFVAKNDTGLVDEDSDAEDWIEIFNATDAPLDLTGWFLTDDAANLSKWQFPPLTLAAQEYRVIFASGKNRNGIEGGSGEMHTNFSLSADGEYLALVRPDGLTVVSDFGSEFPPQLSDTSYGYQGPEQVAGFFATPTPGAENTGPLGLVLQPPLFSLPNKILLTRENLDLTPAENSPDGTIIRYTTDGSNPGASSDIWTGSLRLLRGMTVKARAYDPANVYDPSEIVTRSFIKTDADLNDFTSNLPIVVIDSFGIDVDGLGNNGIYSEAFAAFIDVDEETGRSSVLGEPDFMGNSGVRVRGSSSAWLFPKKQYRLETWDQFGEDRDVSLFGLPKDSDWVLNAPWADKTMMRNHIAYRQSEMMGGYSVRTHFFEMFFNSGGGSVGMDDYQGIYVLVERVKIAKDRLDLAKLDPEDVAGPDVTGGYIIRKDRIGNSDRSVTTSIERVPLLFHEPSRPNSAQISYLRTFLNNFESALHGNDFADPEKGFRAYIDQDSWIDQHLLTEGLRNADGYRLSTYYYKDRNGPLKAGPAWDYNLALGNASFNGGQSPTGWHYEEMDPTRFLPPYPWFGDMFRDPAFTLRYWDRYFQIREAQWNTTTLMAEIDKVAELLSAEATAREFVRWPTLGKHTYANAPGYQNRLTYQSEVDAMKDFLSARFDWMDTQFDPPPTFSLPGGETLPGSQLSLASDGGGRTIRYTLDGSDPFEHPESALIYEGPLTIEESTWVKARTLTLGGKWGALATARYLVNDLPLLAISEINYRPGPASADEEAAGFSREDFEFLELVNPGSSPLDLSGARFTRGLTFTFGDLVLAPGERVIIVENSAAFELRYGTPSVGIVAGQYRGNLDNDGETLAIEDRDRRPLLSMKYNDAFPWPVEADGDGRSLTNINPTLSPDDPSSWRASLLEGGSPGISDAAAFSGDPGGDANGNGISNLVEYALGTGALEFTGREKNLATFTFVRRLNADDATVRLEISPDLRGGPDGWSEQGSTLTGRTANGDGTETLTFSIPADEKLFARLVVELNP